MDSSAGGCDNQGHKRWGWTRLNCQDEGILRETKQQMELLCRGAMEVVTKEELSAKICRSLEAKKPLKVKLGVDPSAPDLHLGHVVVMRKLREFQECGHEIYFVIGDFTGMIGDPSGRSETRPQLSREQVEANAETYRRQATLILDAEKTHMVFNSQWLSKLDFYQVIHLASKFTVARMLERDDFQKRYSQGYPIAIHEFLYSLAQAYDSVALGADVELGGSDQTFNLLVGRQIQKEYGQEPQVSMTMPLLVGLDGQNKMSKSLGNYVGVTDPPAEMFGKIMSLPDSLMKDYFTLVLGDDPASVDKTMRDIAAGKKHPMDTKLELARRIVASFYGLSQATWAEGEFLRVFREKQLPSEIGVITPAGLKEGDRVAVARLLVLLGLVPSSSEGRRLIAQGGVKIDGETVTSESGFIAVRDGMLVQIGKRKACRLSFDRPQSRAPG